LLGNIKIIPKSINDIFLSIFFIEKGYYTIIREIANAKFDM
jgi:hypothetical protein